MRSWPIFLFPEGGRCGVPQIEPAQKYPAGKFLPPRIIATRQKYRQLSSCIFLEIGICLRVIRITWAVAFRVDPGLALSSLKKGRDRMKTAKFGCLIAALVVGGRLGEIFLTEPSCLKAPAFFAVCGVLGLVFHQIDKRITAGK